MAPQNVRTFFFAYFRMCVCAIFVSPRLCVEKALKNGGFVVWKVEDYWKISVVFAFFLCFLFAVK